MPNAFVSIEMKKKREKKSFPISTKKKWLYWTIVEHDCNKNIIKGVWDFTCRERRSAASPLSNNLV